MTSNTASLSAIGAHLRNERYYRLPLLMACAWGRCRTRRFSTLQIWLLSMIRIWMVPLRFAAFSHTPASSAPLLAGSIYRSCGLDAVSRAGPLNIVARMSIDAWPTLSMKANVR